MPDAIRIRSLAEVLIPWNLSEILPEIPPKIRLKISPKIPLEIPSRIHPAIFLNYRNSCNNLKKISPEDSSGIPLGAMGVLRYIFRMIGLHPLRIYQSY